MKRNCLRFLSLVLSLALLAGIVPAFAAETDSSTAAVSVLPVTAGEVDLTREGTIDWYQFSALPWNEPIVKNTEVHQISNISTLGGSFYLRSDNPYCLEYQYSDAAGAEDDTVQKTRFGAALRGTPEGGLQFDLASSEGKEQVLTLFLSNYNSHLEISLTAGEKVLCTTEAGNAKMPANSPPEEFQVTVKYKTTEPAKVAVRCLECGSYTNLSINAAVISEKPISLSGESVPETGEHYAAGSVRQMKGGVVDLTAVGTLDWTQFNPGTSLDAYAVKNTQTPQISDISIL